MAESLTHSEIEQVVALLRQMTPGPYHWGTHPSKTHTAAVRWIAKSIRQGTRTEMDLVWVAKPESTDVSLFVAVTGNGPMSPANAQGLAYLLTAAPFLCEMAHRALATEELLQTYYRHDEQFKALLDRHLAAETNPDKRAAFAEVRNWID